MEGEYETAPKLSNGTIVLIIIIIIIEFV